MTASTQFFDGIPCLVPNRVTQTRPEFYVSYNSYDTSIYGDVTTAVVTNGMERFYVLSGNHEKQLAGKTWDETLAYLHEHAAQLNKYSDKLPPIGTNVTDAIKLK